MQCKVDKDKITELMWLHGFDSYTLAEQAGLTYVTINNMKRGLKPFRLSSIVKVAEALQVDHIKLCIFE